MFKSIRAVFGGAYKIVVPNKGGAIELIDIIVCADGKTNAVLSIGFNDGENVETIFETSLTSNPLRLVIHKLGWKAWRNAWLELVLDGNTRVLISAKYTKLSHGLDYKEWDKLR